MSVDVLQVGAVKLLDCKAHHALAAQKGAHRPAVGVAAHRCDEHVQPQVEFQPVQQHRLREAHKHGGAHKRRVSEADRGTSCGLAT